MLRPLQYMSHADLPSLPEIPGDLAEMAVISRSPGIVKKSPGIEVI